MPMTPTATSSAAAQTTTQAIPNLHGGRNPATPKLAGIICGACLLFGWTVCFIYWWWHRPEEIRAREEMMILRRQKEKEFRAMYPPGSKVPGRRTSTVSRPRSSIEKPLGRATSPTSGVGRTGGPSSPTRPTRDRPISPPSTLRAPNHQTPHRGGHHGQDYTAGHIQLEPMAEVTTKEENGYNQRPL